MSRKLFGTDGIRGVAGEYPLDGSTVFAIGRALGDHLSYGRRRPQVVIGQDTRESSGWIADAVAVGLASAPAEISSAGVITTPGIAFLTRELGFDAGVVISASHNPWIDNGIKVFGSDGYKLSDEIELSIEKEIFRLIENGGALETPPEVVPTLPGDHELREHYENWLKSRVPAPKVRGKIIIDCANGAASACAPELFAMLGLETEFIHYEPNGRNINDHCGALYPQVVAERVKKRGAIMGITFDGDADRALFADRQCDSRASRHLGHGMESRRLARSMSSMSTPPDARGWMNATIPSAPRRGARSMSSTPSRASVSRILARSSTT